MISCLETMTQHISGQPFCNMSMEASEMIVKHTKHLLCCRLAKSGEGWRYLKYLVCLVEADASTDNASYRSCENGARRTKRAAPHFHDIYIPLCVWLHLLQQGHTAISNISTNVLRMFQIPSTGLAVLVIYFLLLY